MKTNNVSLIGRFAKDEIDSIDILAPYRNFEWSEYNEID